jgi:hypothetical protein
MFHLRYLWIDALCIIQDCAKDMRREIPKMRDIFRGSFLTILASRSSHVQQGFLHDREVDYGRAFQLPYISLGGQQPGSVILCKESTLRGLNNIEPLDMRAWALQERLLSPRIVEFGCLATSWYGNSHEGSGFSSTDGGRAHQQDRLYHGALSWFMLQSTLHPKSRTLVRPLVNGIKESQVWAFLVNEYTSRNLTVSTDRLPAISGLAQVYEGLISSEDQIRYIAGLWYHQLPEGLLWKKEPRDIKREITQLHLIAHTVNVHYDSKQYVAPTWSWASVPWKVNLPLNPNLGCQSISAKVIEAEVKLQDVGNEYGGVQSGHLILKGPMFRARCTSYDGHLISPFLNHAKFGNGFRDEREGLQPEDIDVWCLEICVKPCEGLVLRLTDRRLEDVGVKEGLMLVETEEPNTFKRIGTYVAELRIANIAWNDYTTWSQSWEQRDIRLI